MECVVTEAVDTYDHVPLFFVAQSFWLLCPYDVLLITYPTFLVDRIFYLSSVHLWKYSRFHIMNFISI